MPNINHPERLMDWVLPLQTCLPAMVPADSPAGPPASPLPFPRRPNQSLPSCRPWGHRSPSFPPRPSEPALYLLLLSLLIAALTGVGMWYLGAGWFGGTLLGFVAFAAVWIVGMRRLARRLQPSLSQVQQQAQAGNIHGAIATLQGMLGMANWVPMLKGQVHAQLGILHHHLGDSDEAERCLQQAGRRAGDAQLLLACLRFRADRKDEAFVLLAAALPFNRRHVLLHNVYAWLLNREGRRDEAMQVLNRLLQKEKNETSKDNLLRLQNDQRMNMKSFGLPWYALGFEQPPPEMGQLRTARKGFRQPPKQRGRG